MSDGQRRGGDERHRDDQRGERGSAERVGDDELREQVTELAETLADLEGELREGRRRPRLRDLVRFTREVTIPGVILVLRTNIEALKLLQRALAFGDPEGSGRESQLRDRAEAAGRSALSELDSALEDLGDALSGTPRDGRARDLLAEARDLQAEVESELSRRSGLPGPSSSSRSPSGVDEPAGVDIDVDAELRSIKDELGDEGAAGDEGGGGDEGDGGEESGGDGAGRG
ncbi:DUF7547 family protein [Salinirussus salinus]|jgi:hypothetical protein|uniref:DUF7547 family protein n=1 Tax=Salinirussus salinus TaxID=1198300 RepID=UPI001F400FCB|nr:hypothetical protein [Salinirussus salinus]